MGRKTNATSRERPISQNKNANTTSMVETTKGGKKEKTNTKKSNEGTLGTTKGDLNSSTNQVFR